MSARLRLLCWIAMLGLTQLASAQPDPYEQYIKNSADFKSVRQDPEFLLKAWPGFIYMPWTYHWHIGYSDESAKWALAHGYNGAFIDRGQTQDKLAWIDKHALPFYMDHTAGKGDLHLWDGSPPKGQLLAVHGTGVRVRPVNAAMKEKLKGLIRQHIQNVKQSPNRAAYALDDEISWGHFVHPTMWCVTDDKSAYEKWLKEIYGPAAPRRDSWISYSDLFPKLSKWTIADFDASPLMNQWTFNDAYWCNFLGELVEYANSLDPQTPCGFVGGQAPNAFGGYDYARLMRKVQFLESYNLGSSQAIIRSLNPGNAIPAVTTHFHKSVDDSIWQAWYYLAHGNRGFIGWVEKWFEKDGTPRPWHDAIGSTLLEVEKHSKVLSGARWRHEGIAIYYSHPSIQLSWILDAQAHGRTWINRNDDHRLGSSHLVRKAWENMLRDQGLQYDFLSYVDVIQKGVPPQYRVVILPACLCLSDVEARRLREFVEAGGTLIADYLPGLWDQHGRGRQAGGALDELFDVRHDPSLCSKDLFNGTEKLWVETDQDANFSYKTYEELVTKQNSCLKDACGFNKAVRQMEIAHVSRAGRGKAVLLNLSPQWYNAYRAADMEAAQRRQVFLRHVPVQPWVRLKNPTPETFGYEITCWDNPRTGRSILFLVQNPEITGTQAGGGNSAGLKTATRAVTLQFSKPLARPRDERAGKDLPSGQELSFTWTMNQAIVLSFDTPQP